jgi:hypothetical protein
VVAVEETGERKPLVLETHQQLVQTKEVMVAPEVHPLQTMAGLVEVVLLQEVAMGQEPLVVQEVQELRHL